MKNRASIMLSVAAIAISVGLLNGSHRVAMACVPIEPQALSCVPLTQLLLAELGVSAQSLAAVGASDLEVDVIVSAARNMCTTSTGTFAVAQQSVEAVRATIQSLENKVQSGEATEIQIAELNDARAELQAAIDARSQVLDQVRVLVAATLTTAQSQMLTNIASARSVNVPIEYKVVGRAQSEWDALRDILSERARAERNGATPPALPQQPSGVLDAKSNLTTRLENVRMAWRAALAS